MLPSNNECSSIRNSTAILTFCTDVTDDYIYDLLSLQIRGRGFDYATLIRDFNLIKWFGANSIRTSKHPPPEELLELTDKYGIMVIDESPALGAKEVYQYVVTLRHLLNFFKQSYGLLFMREISAQLAC